MKAIKNHKREWGIGHHLIAFILQLNREETRLKDDAGIIVIGIDISIFISIGTITITASIIITEQTEG